jgi:predicted 3-demethylubiquinone-9 3-methyltransferase (glyoxalase superfamily)
MNRITPFPWYDGRIEEAVSFYRSVFPNSKVHGTSPGPNGSLMSATIELEGQQLMLFGGGPHYKLTPAISLYVHCESQAEGDDLWTKLLAGGGKESQCGWLEDRFGLSWQVIPSIQPKLLGDKDRDMANRAMNAMLKMKKIDIAGLERAAAGG